MFRKFRMFLILQGARISASTRRSHGCHGVRRVAHPPAPSAALPTMVRITGPLEHAPYVTRRELAAHLSVSGKTIGRVASSGHAH